MSQPIEIVQLLAYDGPNIFGPSPGVLLRARCDADRSGRLRAALRDGALAAGLVIAGLNVEARPLGDGHLLSATFATETPTVGAALAEYVVAGIAAEAAGDEAWDPEGPLNELQGRLRVEAVPLAALQLVAEARARGLPTFALPGGRLQLGHGARGWSFDPAPLRGRGAAPPTPPWERLGAVPIVAVTGATGRAATVRRFGAELAAAGAPARALDGAGFDEARALLADPGTEALVLGLDTGDILRRGLPFDRCELAVITDMGGARPPEAADDDEWLRALGVPMLLAPQPARLNLGDPALLPLVPYAPNGVVGL
ncbi:MAG TPA: DUF4938 domain-containing protein [Chloroflexaceae bacterium]|nr:DUF4938 domain-containing protein [Chloroflexaceae bacterium]